MDMRIDSFASMSYGQVALRKLAKQAKLSPNFRLYKAGWLGKGNGCDVMEVVGAEFRESKSGASKGKLCIKVSGTDRKVYVTAEEMRKQERRQKKTD